MREGGCGAVEECGRAGVVVEVVEEGGSPWRT